MEINNLVIELTRRCNMTCDHCLRGDIQDKDITYDILSSLLAENDITYIQSVIFTGGEPSLYGQGITDFIDLCVYNDITIGTFYMTVNGKECSDAFLSVLEDLYDFCTNKAQSKVDISRTMFHTGQDEDIVTKLKTLSFVYEREEFMESGDFTGIRRQGRGEDSTFVEGEESIPQELIYASGDNISGILYLNVNGDICAGCDLSYTNQDINKLGNITEETLSDMLT